MKIFKLQVLEFRFESFIDYRVFEIIGKHLSL